jgi:hypothetical protein
MLQGVEKRMDYLMTSMTRCLGNSRRRVHDRNVGTTSFIGRVIFQTLGRVDCNCQMAIFCYPGDFNLRSTIKNALLPYLGQLIGKQQSIKAGQSSKSINELTSINQSKIPKVPII